MSDDLTPPAEPGSAVPESDTWEIVPVDLHTGLPTGPQLAFACTRCGDTVPTQPPISTGCRCGNIYVDTMGRILIEDQAEMRVLRRSR